MLRLILGTTRLAVCLLALSATSAFGALYTFNLTADPRITSTSGGGIVVASVEDANVTVTLTALAAGSPSIVVMNPTGSGVDNGVGGGPDGEDDLEGGAGAETLVITPSGTGPFTLVSATFTNTETGGGGDDAAIFLDQLAADDFDIAIGDASGTSTYNAPANTTFTTFVAFENTDGNDDFLVSQLVLDIDTAAVPEPTTWTLFGAGIVGLALLRRKRASK